jgi:hypothetical protein
MRHATISRIPYWLFEKPETMQKISLDATDRHSSGELLLQNVRKILII